MANVYELVNGRIMELLEHGVIPWKKPWRSGSMPMNLVSKRQYRGVNLFLLSCSSFGSPYWLTYKQCLDIGGHVRKGEKSMPVVFWKMPDKDDEAEQVRPILKYYNVFNAEQCDDIEVPVRDETVNRFEPIEKGERIITDMPLRPEIRHGGNRAYYSPSLDYIQLPHRTDFETFEGYYCTLFHEFIHATGHVNRLARKSVMEPSYFGSHEYSKEELVAEMGAAFLCGSAGIANSTLENSAAYLQGWLKALRNDKTLLIHAAAQGQKAADYVLNRKPETAA